MKIKDLKKGDFFIKINVPEPRDSQVWIRGEYNRSIKKYECQRFDDVNVEQLLSGDREVFTDFTF